MKKRIMAAVMAAALLVGAAPVQGMAETVDGQKTELITEKKKRGFTGRK